MSSVTANSRMIYAFSRDGAVPGHRLWHKVNKRTGTPTNSIWLATVGAFILFLPYLYNPNAYAAVISIAVIGLYIAYAIPIFLRLRAGDSFQRGPWHLGRWSRPVGIVAVTWVCIICVLFILPTVFPVTLGNLNYTIVAVAAVGLGTGIWWLRVRTALVHRARGSREQRGARGDRGGARRGGHARCRVGLSEHQATNRHHLQPAARGGVLRPLPARDRGGGAEPVVIDPRATRPDRGETRAHPRRRRRPAGAGRMGRLPRGVRWPTGR